MTQQPPYKGSTCTRRRLLHGALGGAVGLTLWPWRVAHATAQPSGQLTVGVHVTLSPTWFDPAETPGIITPFMFLYALHDALVKPMPGKTLTPSLAEFLVRESRRTHLRISPAFWGHLPQRRPPHHRRCQIQLPPLQGHGSRGV